MTFRQKDAPPSVCCIIRYTPQQLGGSMTKLSYTCAGYVVATPGKALFEAKEKERGCYLVLVCEGQCEVAFIKLPCVL